MGASHPKHLSNSEGGDPSGRNAHHSSHHGAAYAEEQHDGIEVDIPFDASMECMQLNEFPVVMKWKGPGAKRVFVSGSWDDWKAKIPLSRSHDDFATILNLQQGYHTYAYEVDGEWKCDDSVPKVVNPGFSDRVTNVLEIDRAEYEVRGRGVWVFTGCMAKSIKPRLYYDQQEYDAVRKTLDNLCPKLPRFRVNRRNSPA